LGAVSYSLSIVTMAVSVAVCEMFSVKEWCDLENRGRVRSRSLEMAPLDIVRFRYTNFSTRGRPGGTGHPCVNLGPPNISEITRARKLKLKPIRYDKILALGIKN